MKKNIHPKYHSDAKITCSCGNVIETGSALPEMKVEICSACHPFYTGKKKMLDATGRVDRFKKMTEKAQELKKNSKVKAERKSAKKVAEKPTKKEKK